MDKINRIKTPERRRESPAKRLAQNGPQAFFAGPRPLPMLVYRTFTLRAPQRLSWRQVYRQFGPNPNNTPTNNAIQNFRRRILRELKKIKLAWPGLNYSTAPGLLILNPSTPAIAPLNQGQLVS